MDTTKNDIVKPPKGAKPEWMFLEERIFELIDALYRNRMHSQISDEWLKELQKRLDEYLSLKERGGF
jgi:hypothetical protein